MNGKRIIMVWEDGKWIDKKEYDKFMETQAYEYKCLMCNDRFAFFTIPDSTDEWINDNIDYFVGVLINGLQFEEKTFIEGVV